MAPDRAAAPRTPAALTRLLEHAADRRAAADRWRAEGRLVAGYVGADVPVELITAAGMLPLRLAGAPGTDTAPGDRYLGRGLDPVARSVLTRLLAGDYGRLDALVVSRDCEASLRLFYALRELIRIDPGIPLPPVRLVDVLHLPHRTTTRYVLAKIAQLRAALAEWTGHPADDADLAAAIEAHDRLRGLLTRVAALRKGAPARLTGVQALAIVAATTALPVDRASELLEQLLVEVGAGTEAGSGSDAGADAGADAGTAAGADISALPPAVGTRAFLTGSSHDSPEVYAALEAAGLLVVGEDHDWGELLFHRSVGGTTELALAERYQHNGPSAPRASIRARAAHTAAAARACGAEVLVSYAREHDDGPPWDFPVQRAAAGLPAVLLERQPYGALTSDAAAALVALIATASATSTVATTADVRIPMAASR